MLRVDRGTDKQLIIFTSPDCEFCRMLNESGRDIDLPITKIFVLAEASSIDRLVNKMIFKAKDPMATYTKLLGQQEEIFDWEVDYNKDVTQDMKDNDDMNKLLAPFNPQGTPMFFLMKDGVIIEQIQPPAPDMGKMLLDTLSAKL